MSTYLLFDTVWCLNNVWTVTSKAFAWRPPALLPILKASACSETAKDWLVNHVIADMNEAPARSRCSKTGWINLRGGNKGNIVYYIIYDIVYWTSYTTSCIPTMSYTIYSMWYRIRYHIRHRMYSSSCLKGCKSAGPCLWNLVLLSTCVSKTLQLFSELGSLGPSKIFQLFFSSFF